LGEQMRNGSFRSRVIWNFHFRVVLHGSRPNI
jgi:hypothetical protein